MKAPFLIINLGWFELSAISRVDIFGGIIKGFDVEAGHHGKSSIAVGFCKLFLGIESKTFESFDGKDYYHDTDDGLSLSFGKEIGVGIAYHYNVSVSLSGILDSFRQYGEKRNWW